ncbi:MAG: DoxX family protein [Nitrospirota bacterium]
MLRKLFITEDSWAMLVLRLALGVVFLAHGSQKVLGLFGGPGLSQVFKMFSGMGIPPFFTALDVAAEFLGGLFLIIGFLTRISALGIAVVMVVAVYMVHWHNGFFMNWFGQMPAGREGFEYHILAFGAAIALVFKGGGRLSLDRVAANKL